MGTFVLMRTLVVFNNYSPEKNAEIILVIRGFLLLRLLCPL